MVGDRTYVFSLRPARCTATVTHARLNSLVRAGRCGLQPSHGRNEARSPKRWTRAVCPGGLFRRQFRTCGAGPYGLRIFGPRRWRRCGVGCLRDQTEVHRLTASSLVAGEGFLVLPPAGDIIAPEVRVGAGQREFTLRLDPPRAGGEVRVQRSVRAGDAHPIEETFRFTIRLRATPAPRATTAPTPDESSDGPDVTSEPHARTKRGG